MGFLNLFKSKTIVFNLAMAIIPPAFNVLADAFGMSIKLTAEDINRLFVEGNVLLRFLTNQSLAEK